MIIFLFQTFVGLVFFNLIVLEGEHTYLILCSLFSTEQGFISANAISRNSKYTDLCRYSLTVSEGITFQFSCCPEDCDHFSLIYNSLLKRTALRYTD